MMRILAVCREYGRDMSWWDGLSQADQTLYLAEDRVRRGPAKPKPRVPRG